MRRLFQPFFLTLLALLAAGYLYCGWRLAGELWQRVALALPFLMVWVVPAVYWTGSRQRHGRIDELIHQASYLCMAWISFLVVLAMGRDALLLGTAWHRPLAAAHAMLAEQGAALVYAGSLVALAVGMVSALRGPRLRRVDIAVAGLHPALDGLSIVQISDLHVGMMIRRPYVDRVARLTRSLAPDLVVLTGDIVDGPVGKLADDVAPLAELARESRGRAFFILGNHDCYAGLHAWCAHFKSLGYRVLLNEHVCLEIDGARLYVAGVTDPAARASMPWLVPRPDLAIAGAAADGFKLLLAHNPGIARTAAASGFHLQLSGHTHAGQFFPWTLAVRLVHAPHVAGLSREGAMQVYVSAGTGTWGPPVRLGTQPELTLLRLRPTLADQPPARSSRT